MSLQAFGQTGIPRSIQNATDSNVQNATNPVPPSAPGAAAGQGQSPIPAAIPRSSSAANTAKDTAITAQIKRALLADALTSGNDIHVTTDNRVVTLRGEVHVNREALEAAKIARRTSGVREVVNQLVVTSESRGNG